MVEFRVFIPPSGYSHNQELELSERHEKLAAQLINDGWHFSIERLTTGELSVTLEKDDDFEIMLCDNNTKATITALETIILRRCEKHPYEICNRGDKSLLIKDLGDCEIPDIEREDLND